METSEPAIQSRSTPSPESTRQSVAWKDSSPDKPPLHRKQPLHFKVPEAKKKAPCKPGQPVDSWIYCPILVLTDALPLSQLHPTIACRCKRPWEPDDLYMSDAGITAKDFRPTLYPLALTATIRCPW